MEEKKKKVRPTVALMREMENTIQSQSMELCEWREKYDRLFKENKRIMSRGLWARIFNR